MQTNDHPQDSIPAFVLGALDIDEALLVNAHVIECPGCRAFDTLDWRVPAHAAPAALVGEPPRGALPAPVTAAGTKPGRLPEGAVASGAPAG